MAIDGHQPEPWDPDRAEQLRQMVKQAATQAFIAGQEAGRITAWIYLMQHPNLN